MELTGKCKEDFEKWLVCEEGRDIFEPYYTDDDDIYGVYEWFLKHHKSMQYGVCVDFFDSVDIRITLDFNGHWFLTIDIYDDNKITGKTHFFTDIKCKTRQEARRQAIISTQHNLDYFPRSEGTRPIVPINTSLAGP